MNPNLGGTGPQLTGLPPLSLCLLSPVPETGEARERLEQTGALIGGLAPSCVTVNLVLLGNPARVGELGMGEMPITVIPAKDPLGFLPIFPLRKFLRRTGCDLVHLQNFPEIPWSCLGAVGLARIMADPSFSGRENPHSFGPFSFFVSAFLADDGAGRPPIGRQPALFPSKKAVLDLPLSKGDGGGPSGGLPEENPLAHRARGYAGVCRTLVREEAFLQGRRGRTLIRRAVGRLFSRPAPAPGTLRVLMYHRVAGTSDRDILTVTPFAFAQQMRWLREEGWEVLPVREALLRLEKGSLPPKAAAITFDDGYRDNFEEAFPILLSQRFPATVFPVTGFVLGESEHRRYRGSSPPVPYLTVEQIREMKGAGIDFGGHTHTHPLLAGLTVEAATEEILRAKKLLEEWTGEKSTLFAYPNGVYSRDHFRILDGLGYEAAFSVRPGANRSGTLRWVLRRTEISGRDSLGDFIQKMNGGLDLWHGLYQGVRGFYR